MAEIKRMTATERDVIMGLTVADQIITNARTQLRDDRYKMIAGMKRDLAMMEKKLDRILEEFLKTIPTEQILTYRRTLFDSSYTLGVTCRATSNNEQKRKDEYGMYLTFAQIEGLLDGAREKCKFCLLEGEDLKRCPLRKTLDQIPNDAPESDGTDCPYYRVM